VERYGNEVSQDEQLSRTFNFAPSGVEPACVSGTFRTSHNNEWRVANRDGVSFETFLHSILDADRHCPEWYPYIPGLSPKEHREELGMMQLEKERKEFQLLSQIERDANRRLTTLTKIATFLVSYLG
jgi:hypothetical protein